MVITVDQQDLINKIFKQYFLLYDTFTTFEEEGQIVIQVTTNIMDKHKVIEARLRFVIALKDALGLENIKVELMNQPVTVAD